MAGSADPGSAEVAGTAAPSEDGMGGVAIEESVPGIGGVLGRGVGAGAEVAGA